MTSRSYTKGRRFEYRVRDFFRSKGFYVVRSAKSSFPDLIVISTHGKAYFIECKNKQVPKNPIKLLSKEEYNLALNLIRNHKIQFYIFYNLKGKIKRHELVDIDEGGYGTEGNGGSKQSDDER